MDNQENTCNNMPHRSLLYKPAINNQKADDD